MPHKWERYSLHATTSEASWLRGVQNVYQHVYATVNQCERCLVKFLGPDPPYLSLHSYIAPDYHIQGKFLFTAMKM